MGQVVVWGNGDTVTGQFKVPAGKTAVSAEAVSQSGGVRVDWGGGDVVILPGESWTETPSQATCWGVRLRTGGYPAPGTAAPSGGYGALIIADGYGQALWYGGSSATCPYNSALITPPEPTDSFLNGQALSRANGHQNYSFALINQTPANYSCNTNTNPPEPFSGTILNYGLGIYRNGSFVYERRAASGSSRFFTEIVSVKRYALRSGNVWTVTTNTGATAQKAQRTSPVVSSDSTPCKVTITYSDASNQDIVLTNCADWSRIEDASQCPPGSCSCDHRDYRCCIGSNGQVIKKIRL
ncbi:hypothetical protein [Picosynechococcus sp. PCC 7117]|uniref:hypothetical protein n=1 Tax=Picosynechococcus sp. PCC 7117 TaxID=195498 RepID=UPI0012EE7499|nr:hypothetical protein [Picosynechococcus sp. PCC 7117]